MMIARVYRSSGRAVIVPSVAIDDTLPTVAKDEPVYKYSFRRVYPSSIPDLLITFQNLCTYAL